MTLKEKIFDELFDDEIQFKKDNILPRLSDIADEFAIGFAEWLLIIYNEDIIYDAYSKEQLLEIYKKEKGL